MIFDLITYSEVVAFVVMLIEYSKQFWFSPHMKLFRLYHTLINGLSGKFLDLNVEEFSKIAEPFDQLRSCGPGELKINKQRL